MCIREVNTCYFIFNYVSDWYINQEMCDKAVDDYSIAFEFVPDWYKSK